MEMRVGSLSPGGCHLTGASEHEVAVHKALRHAASHPSTRDATDALVNKRRLEWRNSHRNYRSTPASASREHTVTYEARRALRDHLTIESPPPSPAPSSSYSPSVGRSVILPSPLEHNDVDIGCVQRRALPRRGGSMREPISPKDEFSCVGMGGQKALRCRLSSRLSRSNKRWRCHTVDCPCTLAMERSALVIHRHSFPSEDDHNQKNQEHQKTNQPVHQCQTEQQTSSKEAFYSYLNRSESLNWNGFQSKIDDVDDVSQGSASRIAIRYNDPGSLESVNEDNLFFCLEAGTKNEFRQRLEKTIHAQYRQVWELRANLEERSDFHEMSSSSPELDCNLDMEMPISYTTSFESNLGSLTDDRTSPVSHSYHPESNPVEGKSSSSNCPSSSVLFPNNGVWKRQSYRSIAMNSRLRLQQGTSPPSGSMHPAMIPVTLAHSSFDSIDTIETSSTDASRLEHVTTSFESSATADTTTTDSTTGDTSNTATTGGNPRLLSARGDSGYRSLEVATQQPGTTQQQQQQQQHPGRLTKSLATTLSLCSPDEPSNVDPLRSADAALCQCRSEFEHDEKCERNKPIIFARCTRYGLAKSRSVQASSAATPCDNHLLRERGQSWKSRVAHAPLISRDYSIDERTDALFREFSRCDPVYERSPAAAVIHLREMKRQNASFSNKRWQQQRQEQRYFSLQYDLPPASTTITLTEPPLPLYSSLKE